MIIAALALACSLALPSEGFVSTGCPSYGTEPVQGQWVLDLGDPVFVDFICLYNSDYYVNGIEVAQVYDGATRGACGDAPTVVIDQPPVVPSTPIVAIQTPEPGSAGFLLLGMIAIVGLLVKAAWRRI